MTNASMPNTPVTPVLAATLLLVRDGPAGIEVLLTTRHDDAGFAAGATVFPGGKVDAGDRVRGGDALRLAGIRETFEECGILLARRAGDGAMLSAAALSELLALQSSRTDFGAFVDRAGLAPATDLLVP